MHGSAFDEGPRTAAYLMGNTGKVHFPVSTSMPLAQQFFDQGIGQLHGFWYLEAERSFRQVAALDPDCAMAYWGMAMANVDNESRAKPFIAEAVKRKKGTTAIEAMWIASLGEYYRDAKQDKRTRTQEYVKALKKIVADYPDDIEARAFLAVTMWENKSELKNVDNKEIDALIDSILKINPTHPALHYKIHLLDRWDPSRALPAAAMCGNAAPGIAHMWHMPGHIYSDLKRYDDAAWQQEASARVDHAYMIRDRVMPYEIHNYAHNNEWLIRNLIYVGRVRDAISLAENMIVLPRNPKYTFEQNRGSGNELGRARLTSALTLNEMWPQYIALAGVYLNEDTDPDDQLTKQRYLGVAYFATGNEKAGLAQVAELEAEKATLKSQLPPPAVKRPAPATRPATTQSANAVSLSTTKPTTKPSSLSAADKVAAQQAEQTRRILTDRISRIDKALNHIRGEQAMIAGDYKLAVELLNKAGDVKKEHLSQAYLRADDKSKAEQFARQAVDNGQNQVYPLANYVDVLYRCGKIKEAREAFKQLRTLAAKADLDVKCMARLQPIAEEFGYPTDWRLARVVPGDIAIRPELDKLGPYRWHPPVAPSWTAEKVDGSSVSLADYKGKPVIVLFYLGYRCLHCIQQLHAFDPAAKDFAKAGISLVAISSDSPDELKKSCDAAKGDGEFPFPLLSDSSLKIFKTYHAYDDFEKTPVHAVFLIDAQGKIRWQNISAEPFVDTTFLLKESKRLLAQPVTAEMPS